MRGSVVRRERQELALGAIAMAQCRAWTSGLYRMIFMSQVPPKPPEPGPRPDDGQGSVVAERKAARVEPPRAYQVVMLNDDFTPMEFVVMVLQEYFHHGIEAATQIMLKIHHEGKAVCGVYTRDVAATKVENVLAAAQRAGHPLQCTMEAA